MRAKLNRWGQTCAAAALMMAIAAGAMPAQSFAAAAGNVQSLTIFDKKIPIRSRIDEIQLKGDDGTIDANMVSLVYLRADVKNREDRPILFAYNGGPGAASAYLNLGMLGPERLVIPPVGVPLQAPFKMTSNTDSILDTVDVVMIDPVGTGFSRLINQDKVSAYHSVDGEGRYLAQFIQQWLVANGRQASPIFLLGESYGGMRTVAITKKLTETGAPPVNLKGVVLLSGSIGILETVQRRTNIIGYAVALKTLAAIAWQHKRELAGGLALEPFLEKVSAFASTDYLHALYMGTGLSATERRDVADRLAALTGVPASVWIGHNLQLTKEEFRVELLKDRGLVVGRYDGRYTGATGKGDPSFAGLTEANSWGMGQLLASRFKSTRASEYRISALPLPTRWTYAPSSIELTNGDDYRAIDYPLDLLEAMERDKALRVFVCGGYFDTTASVGADEYLLARTDFPRDRIQMKHYVGGHMFYGEEESRRAFAADLRKFFLQK